MMLQLHAEQEVGTKSNQYDRPLCSTPMMNENIFVFVAARSASTSCLSRLSSVCFAVFVNRLMGQQRSQVTNQCFNCTSQQLKRSSIIEANNLRMKIIQSRDAMTVNNQWPVFCIDECACRRIVVGEFFRPVSFDEALLLWDGAMLGRSALHHISLSARQSQAATRAIFSG